MLLIAFVPSGWLFLLALTSSFFLLSSFLQFTPSRVFSGTEGACFTSSLTGVETDFPSGQKSVQKKSRISRVGTLSGHFFVQKTKKKTAVVSSGLVHALSE